MAETLMKVHELAKSLNVQSKELMVKLGECGIELKNHMSPLTEEQVTLAFEIYTQQQNEELDKVQELHDVLIKKAAEEAEAAKAAAEAERVAREREKTMRKKPDEIKGKKSESNIDEKPAKADNVSA